MVVWPQPVSQLQLQLAAQLMEILVALLLLLRVLLPPAVQAPASKQLPLLLLLVSRLSSCGMLSPVW
jgi:hypothetical protein